MRIISKIISPEAELVILSWLKPRNHRVIISFSVDVFVSPLIINSLKYMERFISWEKGIFVVAQFESVVVLSSELLNAKVFCICECFNVALIRFLIEEFMLDIGEFVSLEIE